MMPKTEPIMTVIKIRNGQRNVLTIQNHIHAQAYRTMMLNNRTHVKYVEATDVVAATDHKLLITPHFYFSTS